MSSNRVDEWRRRQRQISFDPPRGAPAESLAQILPRLMHSYARRANLDGITIEGFTAQPEQGLDVWLRKAAERAGEFNASVHLDVLLSWIYDQPGVRRKMREWMGKLPDRCKRNQRQQPFLTGLTELLQSFGEEQGALFT